MYMAGLITIKVDVNDGTRREADNEWGAAWYSSNYIPGLADLWYLAYLPFEGVFFCLVLLELGDGV